MAALGQLLQPKIADAKPEDNLRLPSNDTKRAIPVPWGRVVIAPQLLYSGDFKAVPIKKRIFTGFWFKTIITGYKYYIGLVLGLCYAGRREPETPSSGRGGAVIKAIIWKDRYIWQHPNNSSYINSVFINEPTFWGPEKEEGGVFGQFNFYPGTQILSFPVEPSAYWESQTGQAMPNLKDFAYAEWLGYSSIEDGFGFEGRHHGYVGNTGSLEEHTVSSRGVPECTDRQRRQCDPSR